MSSFLKFAEESNLDFGDGQGEGEPKLVDNAILLVGDGCIVACLLMKGDGEGG